MATVLLSQNPSSTWVTNGEIMIKWAMVKTLAAAVIMISASLTLTACFSAPTTVGSLAIDRAAEVAGTLLAEPDEAQKMVFKRVLLTNYEAIGLGPVVDVLQLESTETSSWTTLISGALNSCRALADGVSETDVMAKMRDDLQQQASDMDERWFPLIAGAHLTAIQAPGSLCP